MKIIQTVDEFRHGVQFVASVILFSLMLFAIPLFIVGGWGSFELYENSVALVRGLTMSVGVLIALLAFVRIGRWRLSDTSDQEV